MAVNLTNRGLARSRHTIIGRKTYVETRLNKRHAVPSQDDADRTATRDLSDAAGQRKHVRVGRKAYLDGRPTIV